MSNFLPKFLTNQNLSWCACTPSSYTSLLFNGLVKTSLLHWTPSWYIGSLFKEPLHYANAGEKCGRLPKNYAQTIADTALRP